MNKAEQDPNRAIRRLNRAGFAVIILLVGGVGGWAVISELQGAVIALGTLVVESNSKKVQHPTGGIVGEILVTEGSHVEAGQIVMRLDDTVTRATLGMVQSQLDELKAREARLLAEREGDETVTFAVELVSRSQRGGGCGRDYGRKKTVRVAQAGANRPARAVARTDLPVQ
jgi:HlyD family secretion protein